VAISVYNSFIIRNRPGTENENHLTFFLQLKRLFPAGISSEVSTG